MREHKHSTDFKVIPFEADHVADLFARNSTQATAGMDYVVKDYIDCMAAPGHGFSLVTNGHLIFSAGVYPVWNGLGEAWVIPRDLVKPYRKQVVKYVRNYLRALIDENGYRRVQSTVRADFDVGQRFMEFLGFKKEAFLESYGPDGADHILYAILMQR